MLLGGRELPQPVVAVIALLGPALLTALVVVGTFSEGSSLRVDAQAAGVAVAGGAFLPRMPMLGAIALGALTAALLRSDLAAKIASGSTALTTYWPASTISEIFRSTARLEST